EPGGLVGTLTSPTTYPSSLAPVSFTSAGLPLAANTTYWIVLRALDGQFEWGWTPNNLGDGVGFQGVWGLSTDAAAFWWTQDIYPTQFAVWVDCAAPSITSQPAGVQACPSGAADFTVGASGAPAYQWQAELDAGVWTNLSNGNLVHNTITIASISGAT